MDDTDLIGFHASEPIVPLEETMDKMQDNVNRWEGGIQMSGGAIVPGKSWIYPISFKFDDPRNLTQKESQDGQETLGVILAPDGNNLKMIDKLRSKSENGKI